jgi:hypothetical protein
MVTLFRLIVLIFLSQASFAWDANGHVLVSHLSYQYLTPKTKLWLHRYLTRAKHPPKVGELYQASVWLDQVRGGRYRHLRQIHYIDQAFGDSNYFQKNSAKNAVLAINEASACLQNPRAKTKDIRQAIKILLHVVADLHQPMHSINYYSKEFPQGDRGGNLYLIHNDYFYGNLHHFWDEGGGYLSDFSWKNRFSLELKVKDIADGQCDWLREKIDPDSWAQDSYNLAKKYAYYPPSSLAEFETYQKTAQTLSRQQLNKAACRLAAVLNSLSP